VATVVAVAHTTATTALDTKADGSLTSSGNSLPQ
jgi:hypothetical protein